MKNYLFAVVGAALMVASVASAQVDYKELGEDWMQRMMGGNYQDYQTQMTQMMGADFFEQMKEAMGKSIDSNRGYLMMPMMGGANFGCQLDGADGSNFFGGMMSGRYGSGIYSSFLGGLMGFFGVILMLVFAAIPIGILALIILWIVKMAKSMGK